MKSKFIFHNQEATLAFKADFIMFRNAGHEIQIILQSQITKSDFKIRFQIQTPKSELDLKIRFQIQSSNSGSGHFVNSVRDIHVFSRVSEALSHTCQDDTHPRRLHAQDDTHPCRLHVSCMVYDTG